MLNVILYLWIVCSFIVHSSSASNITKDCSQHNLRNGTANLTTEDGSSISIKWTDNDGTNVFRMSFKTSESEFKMELNLGLPSTFLVFNDLENTTVNFSYPARLSFKAGQVTTNLGFNRNVVDFVPESESFDLELTSGFVYFNCRQRCFIRNSHFKETFLVTRTKQTFYLKSSEEGTTEEFSLFYCHLNDSDVNVRISPSREDNKLRCSTDFRAKRPLFNLTSDWTEVSFIYDRVLFFVEKIEVTINGAAVHEVGLRETPLAEVEVPNHLEPTWILDCRPKDVDFGGVDMKLLYNNKGLYTIDSDNKTTTIVEKKYSGRVYAIDFNWYSNCFFHTYLSETRYIERVCNGRHYKLYKVHENLIGIAIDWVTGNIYWATTHSSSSKISASNSKGQHTKILIGNSINIKSLTSITLNPPHGYMYWSDATGRTGAYIGKAGMDGSFPTKIIQNNLKWPNEVIYDFKMDEIYWVDGGLDNVGKADPNGKNVRIIREKTSGTLRHMFGATIYNHEMYIADLDINSLVKIDLRNTSTITTIKEGLAGLVKVKALHPSLQPKVPENPCDANGAGCGSLCLLAPGKRGVCACPEGSVIAEDKTTCITEI